MARRVPRIAITGGPCSGKSWSSKFVVPRLRELGFRVFFIEEVATRFFIGGIPDIAEIVRREPRKYYAIQEQILLEILAQIERFERLAEITGEEKQVILLDRGPMDAVAYMPEDYFRAVLEKNQLSLCHVRDSFDGVVHLVTAADGAEEWYGKENNAARRETPEEARIVDKRTQEVWLGAPHLRIIDNSTNFEGKMMRLYQVTRKILGLPSPVEIERKFLLKKKPDFRNTFLRRAQKVFIEQMYLAAPCGEESRIRKRSPLPHLKDHGPGEFSLYYHTWKTGTGLARSEREERISPLEYLELQEQRDPEHRIIRKHRYCFLYQDQYFELDIFMEPYAGLCLLEIELMGLCEKVILPSFLDIDKEVTHDPAYSNYEIAKRK